MTTDAERETYYRLAREASGQGQIVELGAWLGASTAYLAAAVRDSGHRGKVHVYDKFQTRPGHDRKVRDFYAKHGGSAPPGPSLAQFKANLGLLLSHVAIHKGQIEELRWTGSRIALLVCDAPKRVPAISAVLGALGPALREGAVMAWQDFCHFPSFEIPACLYRVRERIEFVEAVVPGTTLVFRVKSQWSAGEVTRDALALARWTAADIAAAWDYWSKFVPAEKAALFECGAAMFLCDIGEIDPALTRLRPVMTEPAVVKKWGYLRANRPDFVVRYAPLFELMAA